MSLRSLVALTAGVATLALAGWALLALEVLSPVAAVALVVAGVALAALAVLVFARRELRRMRRAHAELRTRIEDLTERHALGWDEHRDRHAELREGVDRRLRQQRAWTEALQERDAALQGELEAVRRSADRVQKEMSNSIEAETSALAQQVESLGRESARAVTEVREWTRDRLEEASDQLAAEMAEVRSRMTTRLGEQAEEVDRQRRQEVVLRRKVQALEQDRVNLGKRIDGLRKQISEDDTRAIPRLKEQLAGQAQHLTRLQADALEAGVLSGKRVDRLVSRDDAVEIVPVLIEQGRLVGAIALLRSFDVLSSLNLTQSRALLRALRINGYWTLQERVARRVAELSGKDADAHLVKMVRADLKVFSDPLCGLLSETGDSARDLSGPVLHVVGKALPETQTGYTLRTDYSVRAQAELGIPVLVAVQPGGDGVEHADEGTLDEDGLERVALPGPVRGTVPLDAWLAQYVEALEALVRRRRPSLLHAHSDFLNGAAAILVGRRCGVPVVYEARGFWEESWLSRMGNSLGLGHDPETDLMAIGLPEAYTLRRSAELKVRQGADSIVTLAEVMKSHIVKEHAALRAPKTPRIVLSPNAVDPAAFPSRSRDEGLAAELEIAADDVVIGYVSSMVEYEGIDTLIRALDGLETSRGGRRPGVKVLLVGDGPVLPELRALALRTDVPVIFTGRVDHADVQRYYSLIDIFVVPRRPTNVTQLVTPLKPYEAMATGKALVVSDVAALREIADESRAALTFPARDAGALRSLIQGLVDDAPARAELGRRARDWVITHRTWEANAQVLVDVYGSLGTRWADTGSDQVEVDERLKARGLDLTTISADIAAAEMPGKGWFSVGPDLDPERVKKEGWSLDTHAPIKLDRVSDWSIFSREDRSLAFHVHAWDFVDAFFANGRPGEEDVQFLVQVALSWNADRRHRSRSDGADGSLAYYDMALALRAPRLLLLIADASRHRSTRTHVPELIDLLVHEREALREDEAFNPRTNHGFFTAAAQLHIEKYVPGLPGRESVMKQAGERMAQLVRTQFATDGGHLEHSPDYHRMLLASFVGAVDDGLVTDPGLVDTIRRGRRVLGWMTQPDGTLITMGDSAAHLLRPRHALGDPATTWIATDGADGHPESEELLLLPDSGYAFVRSPQPAPGERLASSYLAVQGGFHSRAHKHADDLSFVWFDRGHEICIDAGRYGYGALLDPDDPLRKDGFFYADPRRRYVESCRGHNTVEMDGRIHDRRRKPYGSAITEAVQEGKIFSITGRAPHQDWVHRRKVNLLPRTRLIVQDSVHSSTEEERQAVAWFLLGSALELIDRPDESSLLFRLPGGDVLEFLADRPLLEPVRGQVNPLRGWRSRTTGQWEEAWSVGVPFDVNTRGSARTELRFRD